MTGRVRSAVCAVAASLALASAAHAFAPAQTAYPFQAPGQNLRGTVDLSQTIALPAASYGPPAVDRLAVSNVATSISLITGLDLELGYKVDLSGRIDPFDASNAHAFDGLFLSSASASMPYTSLANGGNFYGAAAAVADDLHISLGVSDLGAGVAGYAPDAYTALARIGGDPAPYNPRTANSLLAGVSWNLTSWSNLGLMAAQTSERDGILGQPAPGVSASTTALGVSARVHLGDGWVTTATYSEGVTQLDLRPGLNIAATAGDSLRTHSYGIAIAKNGLFGDDSLGLAVSRPALGSDGDFVTLTGGGQRFFSRSNLLAGTTPETDIEVGYITTFLDGSVALQANASYQMNFAGQTGTNAVALLSRARIKF